jgi:hypothetical protein
VTQLKKTITKEVEVSADIVVPICRTYKITKEIEIGLHPLNGFFRIFGERQFYLFQLSVSTTPLLINCCIALSLLANRISLARTFASLLTSAD